MNILENILEEIKEKCKELSRKHWRDDERHLISKGMQTMYIQAEKIIRSHMDDCKTFEFDFTGVKSFDCQCGRHYVNTASDDWIPVEKRLPEDCEEIVLVQVSGKMAENIWFDNAFELATYVNGEGWILENYPECENPKVIAWKPLPEPYRPKKDIAASGKEHIMSRFMTVE